MLSLSLLNAIMKNFFKNWRMRILSARIFLSLLAGKLDRTEQKLPQAARPNFSMRDPASSLKLP